VTATVVSETKLRVILTNAAFKDLTSVFVYGHEVDDFHAVDKNKVTISFATIRSQR
jgi:hypothetical protein